MTVPGFWNVYGRLSMTLAALGGILVFDNVLTRPLAFVTGIPQPTLTQYVMAAFVFALTLLLSRFVRRDIIHGVLERRSGQEMPPLVGDLTGALVMFIGFCVILAVVFQKDVTGVVATGGVGLMVIGLALRDMLLAAFTGVLLNIEKPFKTGDMVRINDKHQGKVERITWRVTTLQTSNHETLYIPNLSLANAVIVNLAQPDTRMRRTVEVLIDYDTSVESAERILFAAALGAVGVRHVVPPAVNARRMERDGVVYEIGFTIPDYGQWRQADHAVIKSVLKCMQDAGIMVAIGKSELIHKRQRTQIADRSLDSFHLIQQCRLFRDLSDETCRRIAGTLVEQHFPAGAAIVRADDPRYGLFIVGEGMAKRTRIDRDGATLIQERLIATEFFGRRSLFAGQPQSSTVIAETNALVYELDRHALAGLLAETPELVDDLANALAQLGWRQTAGDRSQGEPDALALKRLVHLHRGQIAACYQTDGVTSGTFPMQENRVPA